MDICVYVNKTVHMLVSNVGMCACVYNARSEYNEHVFFRVWSYLYVGSLCGVRIKVVYMGIWEYW